VTRVTPKGLGIETFAQVVQNIAAATAGVEIPTADQQADVALPGRDERGR
jgi:hypothetical protein